MPTFTALSLFEAKNLYKDPNIASPEWEIVTAYFLFSNVASKAVRLRYVCPLMIKNPNLHALNEGQRLRQ